MALIPPDPRGPLAGAVPSPSEPRLLTRRDPEPSRSRRSSFAASDGLQRKQFQEGDKPRRRFPLRKILTAWAVLSCLAIIAVLTAALGLRHAMRVALPQLDGTLHLAGLTAPVTVTRDPQGVPSIAAGSLDDLLFAQGFVTAQDRLWQMDALRRHAAGDLAEILGPSLVDHDRQQRTLQLRAAADRAITALPPDQLHQLEAYARGVNAFLDTHRDRLPVEFHLLHYEPAPWSPRDSILVTIAMWQDLSTSFPTKLDREILSAHLSPALVADLYPVGSWRDRPPSQPPPDLTTPRESILQIPLDDTQSSLHRPQTVCRMAGLGMSSQDSCAPTTTASVSDLLRLNAAFPQNACDSCRSGSNNWAVAASRSASKAPLVSNDMHLGLSVPDIWYEASLHATTPQLDVTGFTLPGVPFVVVGRNAHVAWSFTNLGADVQDVRIEHLRGSGSSTEFQLPDGSWSPVQHHPELIRVRAGHDVHLDVLTTTQTIGATTVQTPIISALFHTEQRALSLAWTIYDPVNLGLPGLAFDTATDGSSLVAAFSTFGGPSLNLTYADDAGHIGYHATGRIPIRGPATRRPRLAPLVVLPEGAPPADEEENPFASDQPSAPVPQQPPLLTDPTIPPTPATIDYTIGSPISPLPVDALDPNRQWSGYIPYAELPSVADPPVGLLATANARITPDDYPYAIANDWADPYRVERINVLLSQRTNLTPADMLAFQNDVHSEFDLVVSQRLAYALDHASTHALAPDARRLHQAADLLRVWTGDLTLDSPAAAIVVATRGELWDMLLTPQIAAHDHTSATAAPTEDLARLYYWGERDTALEELLQHQPSRWLPPSYSDWNDFLAAAVARALHTAHAPHDLSTWRYGIYHPVEIAHPLFGSHSFLSRLLGTRTGSGLQPNSGDGTTVRAGSLNFGPSERFTADLANPSATTGNITTGESGNPASPSYLDQFLPWLNGTTFPLPLQNPTAVHTLTLEPNSQ